MELRVNIGFPCLLRVICLACRKRMLAEQAAELQSCESSGLGRETFPQTAALRYHQGLQRFISEFAEFTEKVRVTECAAIWRPKMCPCSWIYQSFTWSEGTNCAFVYLGSH
jgi:hypothetical protein